MSVHSASQNTQPGSARTVADILTAAADLIEPEGAWTQGAFARTAKGHVIGSGEDPAVCFCGAGAVYRMGGPRAVTERALNVLDSWARQRRKGFRIFAQFNDAPERTQAEVVAALRAAADKARTASAVGMEPMQSAECSQGNPND